MIDNSPLIAIKGGALSSAVFIGLN
jgi:hypothetical protein